MNRQTNRTQHPVGFLQNFVETAFFRAMARLLIITQILWGLPATVYAATDSAVIHVLSDLKVEPTYQLISSKRITLILFDFTYKVKITNTGTNNFSNVSATVTSKANATTIMDGSVAFGEVAAGATVTSQDTFTLRQNRTALFNPADLIWTVNANHTPVANAGDGQTVAVGSTVHLDGSASSDSDGDNLQYSWKFVSIPLGSTASLSNPSAAQPTFVADRQGTYVVQLIANDGKAPSPPDEVSISTNNTPPVADARINHPIRVGQTAQLDGSHSSDVDGDALIFKWTLVSAPVGTPATLSDASTMNPTLPIDRAGQYVLELVVNDGIDDSEMAQLIISTENTVPIANAGIDGPIKLHEPFILDGSGSSDVDGDSLRYSWSLISKPVNSGTTLSDSSLVKPSFTPDLRGEYIAQLIVNDGKVDSLPDLVTLTTHNTKPLAIPGTDQTVTLNSTVTLNGSASSDAESDPLTFLWSLTSIPPGSSAVLTNEKGETPQLLVDLPGTYIGQLIVNDGELASDPSIVTISTQNSKPVSHAGIDQQVKQDETVQLDGTLSSDADNHSLTYSWSLLNIPAQSQAQLTNPTASKPTFIADHPGLYVVQLIVNDGNLDSEPDTVVIEVKNQAPIANAGPNQVAEVGQTVLLDGKASSDPDHDKLTFTWRFMVVPVDSGAILNNPLTDTPSFVVDRAGQYIVELTVSDGLEQNAATVIVDIPNKTPPAIISSPVVAARSGQAYGYDVDARDPDQGDVLRFALIDAPTGMTIEPTAGLISWQPGREQLGDFPVKVGVVDQSGLTDTQSYSVTVRNSVFSNATPVISSNPATVIIQGQTYHYDVDATDADGDDLVYALNSAPPGTTIDPITGRIDWPAGALGGFPVVLEVSDGHGGQASQSYVLTVQALNLAPQISSLAIVTTIAGLPYRYAVEASDPNDDELTFSLVKAPTGMAIDEVSGVITWVASSTQVGQDHQVSVRVTDPSGLAGTQDFNIAVTTDLNTAPVANAGPDQKNPPGIAITLDGSGSSDANGDTLSFHWEMLSRPNGSAAVLANPESIHPSFQLDAVGKYTLQLVVNDGHKNSAPDTVDIVSTVVLAAGWNFTCALSYGGKVECWGANQYGQLGIGSFGPIESPRLSDPLGPFGIPTPVTVVDDDGAPLSGITAISASRAWSHTCALTDAGGVKCWGDNRLGELGDGTTQARAAAVDVLVSPSGVPLTGITAIGVGSQHSCAVTNEGGVKCWGTARFGELGNPGITSNSTIPVDVLVEAGGQPLRGATAVSANTFHTCALMEDTSVKCWGNNDWGQLGNGATLNPDQGNDRIFSPVDVVVSPGGPKLNGAVSISAGHTHTCALMENSGVKCWGSNDQGTLGNGVLGFAQSDPAKGPISTTPVDVLIAPGGAPLTGVKAIAAGGQWDQTCALMVNGGVKCWGKQAAEGILGDGERFLPRTTPVDVLSAPGGAPLAGVSDIAAAYQHACAALQDTGEVKCWGWNWYGQLGNGEVGAKIAFGGNYYIPQSQFTPVNSSLGLDAGLIAVTVEPFSVPVIVGRSRQYRAIGILSNGGTQEVTSSAIWESSNPAVATVNATGLVTGVGTGVTRIKATKDGFSRSLPLVLASGALQSIEISPKSATVLFDRDRYDVGCILGNSTAPDCDTFLLDQAQTEQSFTATGVYSGGTRLDLTSVVNWTSTASAVSVSDGVASGQGLGSATVKASLNGIQGSAAMSVMEEVVGDNTPPTVALSPDDNTRLLTPTEIRVTVNDEHLLKYDLSISPPGDSQSQIVASGTSHVDGVVASVDPSTLANGLYTLRLTAVDRAGHVSTASRVYLIQDEAKVGLFRLAFSDLSIPVSGIPIEIVRSYDSRVKSQQDFGVGWSLEVRRGSVKSNRPPGEGWQLLPGGGIFGLPCQTVSETGLHFTEVRLSDQEYYRFGLTLDHSAALSGGCTAEAGFRFVDGSTPGATLEILDGKNVFYENATNQVLKLGSTDEVYNPERFRLTTADGRVIDFDRQVGGVTRIQDLNNNVLAITAAGISHSSGKSIVFSRDAQGRITEITDPNGNKLKYAYDDRGDLVSFTDPASHNTTFKYDNSHYLTEIVDPLGNRAIRNDYDADGRLVATTDAQGQKMAYTHDLQQRREAITDRLGRVTVYEYDERGNVLTSINALGQRTTYTYDAQGNPLTVTDPLGHATTSTYDGSNNLLTETDPLGHVTTNTYNARNQLLTSTDAAGRKTTNIYPITTGNLGGITDPLGHITSLDYDRSGNLASLTDPLGHGTSYEYDGAGNRIKQTDPLGHVTTYTFDTNGNELTETSTWINADGQAETLVIRKEYDVLNRLIKTTDPLGHISRTEYNAAGKIAAQIDPKGQRTEFNYDSLGHLIQTRYPDNTQETVTYDAEGNRTQTTDRAGRTTTFSYDALNRLTRTTHPDGSSTQTAYDAAGREVASLDENGHETSYNYDIAGNRVSVVDALGYETRSSFDAAGQQTSTTDANGRVTAFDYDAAGRRTKTRFPDGKETGLAYDAAGRLTQKIDQAGKATSYEYDAQGQLTAVIDALAQRTVYSYNEQGKLLIQTDANGHKTRYEYDGLGQRTATILPLGQRSTASYDVLGNLVSSTDFNGVTTTYAYDASNRLLTKQLPDGTSERFTYTPSGQRETVTDARGVTRFSYDTMDRLLSRTDPDGTQIGYTYDSAGNRTSVTTPSGTVDYTFDAHNQLETVTANGGVTRYAYDPVGNLLNTDLPNDTAETRSYDQLNRLTLIESRNTATHELLTRFAYTLDPSGNRKAVEEYNGRRVGYVYDALDRLTRENIFNPGSTVTSRTFNYVYDAVGNRMSRSDSLNGATTYSYDHNDRLLTETTAGVTTTYGYDDNGNTVSKAGSGSAETYGWNSENRLVGADINGDGAQDLAYQYDTDGIRVSKTIGGTETRYLIDANRPYAEVLEEMTPAGISKVSYVHGNELIAQERSGQKSYFHVDGLGSTRALSNSGGLTTDRYSYEAYGRTIARSGVTDNAYLFAGEQRDSDLGLDYLRARYLNIDKGRFVSQDLYPGFLISPGSRHRYIYANNSPNNATDPSGNVTLLELSIGDSLRTNLRNLSYVKQLKGFVSETNELVNLVWFMKDVVILLTAFSDPNVGRNIDRNVTIGEVKRDFGKYGHIKSAYFKGVYSPSDKGYEYSVGFETNTKFQAPLKTKASFITDVTFTFPGGEIKGSIGGKLTKVINDYFGTKVGEINFYGSGGGEFDVLCVPGVDCAVKPSGKVGFEANYIRGGFKIGAELNNEGIKLTH